MRRISSNLALCALVACTAAAPARAGASDLWEIYNLALDNDPAYQAALLDHQATELDTPIAELDFKLSVSGVTRVTRQRSDASGANRLEDNNQASLNARWPLFNRANQVGVRQARTRVEASALMLENARQDLVLRVAERYFGLLASRDAREVARAEKIANKRQMDLASERLEVGLGTQTDFFDAQARFKQAEADEILARNQINNNVALLREIIGVTPQALAPLSRNAPLNLPEPNDVDAWIEKSLDGNLPVRAQALNVEVALDEIKRRENAIIPTLDVVGNYTWREPGERLDNGNGSADDATSAFVGVELNFPLYLGGAVRLYTRQAGLRYNREQRRLEQARRAAASSTTAAFLDVSGGASQVEALSDAISAGESALEAKEEGFRAGLTTNLDVLDAQRDLSRTQTDYLRARYAFILSVLKLEQAAGQLDEDDIMRVNGWLEAR